MADLRNRDAIATIMTGKAVTQFMVCKTDITMAAAWYFTALGAFEKKRKPASVLKKNDLFLIFQGFGDIVKEQG
jgi:hypothetical protein